MVEDIINRAEPAAKKLREHEGEIRVIGQYDADGINATAIMYKILERLDKEFNYEILKQLYEEDVERIAQEEEELLVFVDIGSGQSDLIKEHILTKDKQVIISDHHDPAITAEESENTENLVHLNPHYLGYDGGEAISAAGMTYLLA